MSPGFDSDAWDTYLAGFIGLFFALIAIAALQTCRSQLQAPGYNPRPLQGNWRIRGRCPPTQSGRRLLADCRSPPTACSAASGGRSTATPAESTRRTHRAAEPDSARCSRNLPRRARPGRIARADFFPTLSAGPDICAGQGLPNRPLGRRHNYTITTIFQLAGQASWEPDFWGRIRRTVEAARRQCPGQRRRHGQPRPQSSTPNSRGLFRTPRPRFRQPHAPVHRHRRQTSST